MNEMTIITSSRLLTDEEIVALKDIRRYKNLLTMLDEQGGELVLEPLYCAKIEHTALRMNGHPWVFYCIVDRSGYVFIFSSERPFREISKVFKDFVEGLMSVKYDDGEIFFSPTDQGEYIRAYIDFTESLSLNKVYNISQCF